MPVNADTCDWCGRVRTRRIDARLTEGKLGIVFECRDGCKPGHDSWFSRMMSTPIGDLLKGRVYDPTLRSSR